MTLHTVSRLEFLFEPRPARGAAFPILPRAAAFHGRCDTSRKGLSAPGQDNCHHPWIRKYPPTVGSAKTGGQEIQVVNARQKADNGLWLYGLHAARAALANRRRTTKRVVITERAGRELGKHLLGRLRVDVVAAEGVARLLPPGAVHQGVALLCDPLPKRTIDDVLNPDAGNREVVLVLDQISDPHNVGAILRTAAAFAVAAVVVQDRNAPPESGALAKAASGALEIVPYVETVNIARALEKLGDSGYWRIALSSDGDSPLADAIGSRKIALVLGSEGSGIRRLVRERCDVDAFIPIDRAIGSLNVSNAAAIALYATRQLQLPPSNPPQPA
jgi:23S rRNA (guanosine2251-2'-O)-methyltransferase